MKRDSKLSGVLHALLHMAEMEGPVTSESLAMAMQTHPVVVRRVMAGLREAGFVSSAKGHGGGKAGKAAAHDECVMAHVRCPSA